jgi:hypothetical protein
MDQLYLPNLIVNSGTSGEHGESRLTILMRSILLIDRSAIPLYRSRCRCCSGALAPELYRSRTTPDKPIKATVVDSSVLTVA